jgi:glucose-6-phosphate isomerase
MITITKIKPLTQRSAWKALAAHHRTIQKLNLRKMFADDPIRGKRMTVEAAGLYLDYSKKRPAFVLSIDSSRHAAHPL